MKKLLFILALFIFSGFACEDVRYEKQKEEYVKQESLAHINRSTDTIKAIEFFTKDTNLIRACQLADKAYKENNGCDYVKVWAITSQAYSLISIAESLKKIAVKKEK